VRGARVGPAVAAAGSAASIHLAISMLRSQSSPVSDSRSSVRSRLLFHLRARRRCRRSPPTPQSSPADSGRTSACGTSNILRQCDTGAACRSKSARKLHGKAVRHGRLQAGDSPGACPRPIQGKCSGRDRMNSRRRRSLSSANGLTNSYPGSIAAGGTDLRPTLRLCPAVDCRTSFT
jgi:hypothetical protein